MIPVSTVALSPHCDDLPFSLAGTLCDGRWGDLLPVMVFTVSTHTVAGPADRAEVTRLRKEEDACFFRPLAGVRTPVWLDRLDAPLRRGVRVEEVRLLPFGPEGEGEAEGVVAQILPLLPYGADLLSPLGVGGHIDHRIVHRAALLLAAGRTLFFYEDLPYAGETGEEEIQTAAAAVGHLLGRRGEALLFPSSAVRRGRERAVACYHSQTDEASFEALMVHPRRLAVNGVPAERIWKFDRC